MTPLRQRMLHDMTVRGFADTTQQIYLSAVFGLARHYHRSPDRLSPQEVQDYIVFLHKERHLRWNTCNVHRHALRFLYRVTLKRPDPNLFVPGAKQPSVLPQILNDDELIRLFTVTTNLKHRALFMTAYAAGLRASELVQVRICDIDSGRMTLRVRQGKGGKDRYVPLSPRLLHSLRQYWRQYRPDPWLFPGQPAERPLSRYSPTQLFQIAKEKAGITKAGGIHTLRHGYATGLLEAGVELPIIQRRLGHNSIRSTMRYLHLAQDKLDATPSPLDLLDFPRHSRA
jgi:integrase/recombinase XerD